jgi:putative ABC transport system permease protein
VRFRDLLRLALSALYQQKVRTLLTTLGVIAGSFVLLASLSVRAGVYDLVQRESGRFGELRRIDVNPAYSRKEKGVPAEVTEVRGKMSEARRRRLRAQLVQRWWREHGPNVTVRLTADRLRALAALPHVRAVEPTLIQPGRVYLESKSERAVAVAAPDEEARARVVAGAYLDAGDDRGVVVSELLLYLLGITDEDAVGRVVGKKLRLDCRGGGTSPNLLLLVLNRQTDRVTAAEERVLSKLQRRLPKLLDGLQLTRDEREAAQRLLARPTLHPPVRQDPFTEEYYIRGVLRLLSEEERQNRLYGYVEADVLLPPKAGEELFYRLPEHRKEGFAHAVVQVDHVDNVKEVSEAIRRMGLQAFTPVDWIERQRLIVLLIFTGMTAIAAVSLLVAALGIMNTMLMSVLERVREIGVMKAVGARDGHIQMIFLVEGALVGLVGGLLGLLLGWAASFPGDAGVRGLVQQRLSLTLQESIFVFPWWLVAGVPAFACLVTTLAALYPARRAARVNPITALRHD